MTMERHYHLTPQGHDALAEAATNPAAVKRHETGSIAGWGRTKGDEAAANSGRTVSVIRGRPFRPGRSGNPAGRPRRDLELAALARGHTLEVLEALVTIMQAPDSPASARVTAASVLLDRGWGRAPQSFDVKHDFAGEFEKFVRGLREPA
jgi:hypothetical protein